MQNENVGLKISMIRFETNFNSLKSHVNKIIQILKTTRQNFCI